MRLTGFMVRFKGHPCTAISTGFCRKPVLFRVRKGEKPMLVEVINFVDLTSVSEDEGKELRALAEQRARIACARAIKRTEECYRRLRGDHFLRGVPSVERLERLFKPGPTTRKGKRWKICPVYEP